MVVLLMSLPASFPVMAVLIAEFPVEASIVKRRYNYSSARCRAKKPDLCESSEYNGALTQLAVQSSVYDNAVRDVVVRMLSANGFGVLTASDGSEALRILGQRSVDLLFTDIVMPGMDGVELARHARQVRPGLKVLFGTGYAQTGYAQKAIERDAIHQARVVYKPFRQAELVKEIEALLAA
jgi:two-component system, cell cycle response regulator CpdR